jgi:catechol 2,3-dioxygenase-like lactoylglutathione lyase family enzyme
MMELVQQDEEGPSPFRDMYAPGQEGIHHVAMIVDSLEATCRHYADLDVTVAARAETLSGVEFAFLDTTASLGHMLEIYERSDQLQGFYSMVRRAAEGWDGAEPVRSLG